MGAELIYQRFIDAGLYREGTHSDTVVDAIKPDGDSIEVKVQAIQVNRERDTLFVPLPEEANKTVQVFPNEQTNCI